MDFSAPKIVIFLEDKKASKTESHIIASLLELEFAPFVDALHASSYDWFVKNIKSCPHRLFSVDEEDILFYEVDELAEDMCFVPTVAIYFNEGEVISPAHWVCIRHWLEFVLLPNQMETDFVIQGRELMKKPYQEKVVLEDVVAEPLKEKTFYSFREKFVEEDDVMLYEIEKPFTDLPYTCVIRNFSKRGCKSFFTSLYVCTTWGVSRNDVFFLKHLWINQFGFLEQDFDMDEMLKEATEACYPRPGIVPDTEPEVYRRTIEDVQDTLEKRKNGVANAKEKILQANKARSFPQ